MDAYALLGIARTATTDEVRNAYKEQAMLHHPDRGGDPAMWATIQKAYDTLADPQRRAMHDRARELGWTIHDHPGDHALLVGDPEGTTDLILKISGAGAPA